MFKKLMLLTTILFFVLCYLNCQKQIDIEAEKAQIKIVIDKLDQSIKNGDIDLYTECMAHDSDMVTFGTDVAERFVGWDALKESIQKQFLSFKDVNISVSNQIIKVHNSGNVAWYSEIIDWDLVVQDQLVNIKGLRLTGVLEKRNDKWIIVQFHASVPVSGQAAQY